MSIGVNKVSILGHLGKDPEVRFTKGGGAVCNFSVAVNERRKDGDEWKDHVEWFNIVAFGKTAENAGKYLAKGRQVYVDGRLQTRKWQDKEGKDRWTTEVVAFTVLFLGGGGEDGKPRAGDGGRKAAAKTTAASNDDGGGFYDDEDGLPF